MARPKGFKMTEDQKQRLQEGRRKAKEARSASKGTSTPSGETKVVGYPVVYLTGKEKNAFDYYTPIRNTLRGMGDYMTAPKILTEITDKTYWVNKEWIEEKLNKYFTLVVKEESKKVEKKERKPRPPMSPEHKAKLLEALKRARETRQKNKEGQ